MPALFGGHVRLGPLVLAALAVATTELVHSAQPPVPEPPRFRVGVDVIRVDAVVTDKDGKYVTDLTAEDFELRQDGEVQPIQLVRYVDVGRPRPATDSPVSGDSRLSASVAPSIPMSAGPALTSASVKRTMVLVVDDLGIAWENLESTRKALRRFVDEEVQPGDLVALIRTGASWGALQQLTTDRRLLHAAIDQVRWTALSRRGITSFVPVNDWLPESSVGTPGGAQNTGFEQPDPLNLGELDGLRESMSASASLGAVTYAIRGIRDLPGRKAIVLISEGFTFRESGVSQPDDRVAYQVRRLTDIALRTGTVIYAIDPRGLVSGGLTPEDNLKRGGPAAAMEHGNSRRHFLLMTQDAMASVAEQTGGFGYLNSNDIGVGLRKVSDDQRGYYVIGYTPPEGTFAAPGKTPRFHKISVNVRRPGLRVRTREGFIGESDPDRVATPRTPQQELNDAAVSPFLATEIPVRATLVPGYDAKSGQSVRALLHIDARRLTFGEQADGRRSATVGVTGLVLDEWGVALSQRNSQFTVSIDAKTRARTLEAGIVYSLVVPLPRAGGFQVRFAVRDQASGALGAAGEFVAVPDLSKDALALSGVVVGEEGQAALTPDDEIAAEGKISSPALRVFRPGARLVYTYEIYNAAAPVESRVAVWRNGRPYFTAPPATLTPRRDDVTTVAGGLQLGERMPPGDYVLQVTTATRPSRGKPQTAAQWTSFEVRPD